MDCNNTDNDNTEVESIVAIINKLLEDDPECLAVVPISADDD